MYQDYFFAILTMITTMTTPTMRILSLLSVKRSSNLSKHPLNFSSSGKLLLKVQGSILQFSTALSESSLKRLQHEAGTLYVFPSTLTGYGASLIAVQLFPASLVPLKNVPQHVNCKKMKSCFMLVRSGFCYEKLNNIPKSGTNNSHLLEEYSMHQ